MSSGLIQAAVQQVRGAAARFLHARCAGNDAPGNRSEAMPKLASLPKGIEVRPARRVTLLHIGKPMQPKELIART
ncbi:hypothetical protein [Gemmobacter sp. 24YEA27]|uniref:hypothetical protein n=1 Tax=Gemmobacter sp. 24YEA27 TaxID=3040672 RepID=UPI0024B3A962|nr:hypothetical protein [Gemmobacter sp. 24YEA27]